MSRRPSRTSRAALLSAAVVLLPGVLALACADLAARTLTAAVALADPAGALLGLAALALTGVLVWATAAAAAGVAEAWAPADPRPVRTGRGPAAPPPARAPRTRSGAVSAGVAALVAAALAAPAATATSGTGPDARTVVVSQQAEAAPTDPGPPADPGPSADPTRRSDAGRTGPDAAPAPALTAPGTWAALAEDAFLAPRGATVGAAALVTAPPLRQPFRPSDDVGVVVRAGDTLWSIAARHLDPGADDAEVAAAWPRWWQANRHTVGDDPDLLLPGQRLVVPSP